ncbi:hypothetical protein QUA16_27575, partial [Microcoleus sp. S13_C3]
MGQCKLETPQTIGLAAKISSRLKLRCCTIVNNRQDARSTKSEFSCGLGILPVKNGQDARSTKNQFSCGTGILPVPKQVIENGVRCELKLISSTLLKNGQDARSTKNEFSCGVGILPV